MLDQSHKDKTNEMVQVYREKLTKAFPHKMGKELVRECLMCSEITVKYLQGAAHDHKNTEDLMFWTCVRSDIVKTLVEIETEMGLR